MPENKITTDFLALEAALADIERSSVDFWEMVYDEWSVLEGVTTNQFALKWQQNVKTRSASTVNQNLGHIKWAVDNGYDLSSFVSMAHLIEIKSAKKGAAKKSAPKFDAVKTAKKYADLTKRQREALAHALLAI